MDKFTSLKNKTVLITGTSRGIGRSLAIEFLKNQTKVIGISRNKNKIIKNHNYFHYECDLYEKDNILDTVKTILKKFKQVDILINNAGVTKENTNSIDENIKVFFETFKLNLFAAHIISSCLIEKFKKNKNGGTIINISSIAGGELGFPNNPAYLASKAGLIGLTRSFARDYGKYNINCNAVLPGYFKTEFNKKSLNNKLKKKERENLTMLGRWGELEELVSTVLFLSTKGAKYITGQNIIIDGGITSKGL